jgi:hypothetical protein
VDIDLVAPLDEESYEKYTYTQAKYFHAKFLSDSTPDALNGSNLLKHLLSENISTDIRSKINHLPKEMCDDKELLHVNTTIDAAEASIRPDRPSTKRIRNCSDSDLTLTEL